MMALVKKNKLALIIVLVYILLLVFNRQMAFESFGNSTYYLLEMFQVLPVIFMLTVAIDVLIPKEWIIKRLGNKSGISGSFLALAFGSLSAGPIYAAFPITKMLYNKGASVQNIVVILSAWAVVKVPMLANEAKFLGPDFMLVRWGLTVFLIFCMAWIMEKLKIQIKGDKAIKKDQLYIKAEYCIGCGVCQKIAPEFYQIKNGKAYLSQTKLDMVKSSEKDKQLIRKATQKCPSQAIIIQENEGGVVC